MIPRKEKFSMAASSMTALIFLIILQISPLNATYPPLECPVECSCHYFRINWVTECSSKNLTSVPSGLSQSVYILDISKNKISEQNESLSFPEGIKVRRLHLADNKITEVRKDTFVGLSYLLEVDLSVNYVSKLDREAFVHSPGLISLELRRNPLTGPENGKPFIVSPSLKTLDISDCRFRELTAGFFSESTAVSELDLSGNPLETIDPEAFKPLTGLEKLKMNRCRLASLSPTLLRSSQHLKHFEAAWNSKLFAGIGESALSEMLKGLNRLDHLDIRGTGLNNVPSDSFKDTTQLAVLMLAENNISASSQTFSSALSSLENIHELDLEGCHLTLSSISFLANMTKLRILRLGKNDLSQTLKYPSAHSSDRNIMDIDWSISHLKKLKRLSLDHCGLSRLPSASSLSQLSEVLVDLDISDNPLGGRVKGTNCTSKNEPDIPALTALSQSIKSLKMLQTLDMSRCDITQLPKDTFSKSLQLRRLVLSGNALTRKEDGKRSPGIEAGLLSPVHRLEILELADCGFTEPPSHDSMPESKRDEDYSIEIDKKKKKERMEDDEDAILDVSDDEAGPSLRELILAGNPLNLAGPLPPYVSSLEKLDISRCGLTEIPSDTFLWAVNLTQLSISGNALGSVKKSIENVSKKSKASLSNKTALDEVDNGITSETKTESSNSTLIEIIHVNGKSPNPDLSFVSKLPKLTSLDMRRCGLTSFSHSDIANVSLQSLRLAGNPWICGCNLVALWEWASQSGKDILLHRPPPTNGAPVLAATSIEEEHGLRCTSKNGMRMPWSRFILLTHEKHDCGPVPAKLVALASLMHQEPEQVHVGTSITKEINSSSSWAALIGCAVGFSILALMIAVGIVVRNRRRNLKMIMPMAPRGNSLLLNLDEEDLSHMGTVRWAARPYRETTQR